MEAAKDPMPDAVPKPAAITADLLSSAEFRDLINAYADASVPTDDRDKMVIAIRRLLVTMNNINNMVLKLDKEHGACVSAIMQLLKHGVEMRNAMSQHGPVVVWEFCTDRLLPRHKKGGLQMQFDAGKLIVAWVEPGGGIITRPTMSIVKPGG